jgi:hypothetical protein
MNIMEEGNEIAIDYKTKNSFKNASQQIKISDE